MSCLHRGFPNDCLTRSLKEEVWQAKRYQIKHYRSSLHHKNICGRNLLFCKWWSNGELSKSSLANEGKPSEKLRTVWPEWHLQETLRLWSRDGASYAQMQTVDEEHPRMIYTRSTELTIFISIKHKITKNYFTMEEMSLKKAIGENTIISYFSL